MSGAKVKGHTIGEHADNLKHKFTPLLSHLHLFQKFVSSSYWREHIWSTNLVKLVSAYIPADACFTNHSL